MLLFIDVKVDYETVRRFQSLFSLPRCPIVNSELKFHSHSVLVPITNRELLIIFQMFRSWTLSPQQLPAETVRLDKSVVHVLFTTIHQDTMYPKSDIGNIFMLGTIFVL